MNTSAGSGGPPRGPQFDNRRVVAGLIDLVAVAAVAIVLGVVAGFIAGPGTEASGAMPLLVLAWALFYYFALESGNGQTLGKRIMGLRVLMVDGRPADMGAVGARTVLRIIDGIGLYVVGLIAMIATGQRRQRLGDLAGKTIVTSADWKPTAAPAAVTAVATPATSAIVLPSEPAGPEVPAAAAAPAVPSPFTPLAIEPSPVETPTGAVEASPDEPIEATAHDPVAEEPLDVSAVDTAPAPPAWNPEPVAATPEPSPLAPFEEPAVESATAPDPIVDGPADGTWEPVPEPIEEAVAEQPGAVNGNGTGAPPALDEADEYDEDEPVRVRSVETMSAMDMLMSELEEDEPAGQRPAG